MKCAVICLSILFSFQHLSAQISGRLITSDQQPAALANVFLLKYPDSSLVKAALTDEQGKFKIENIPTGNYFLRVSGVGYIMWSSSTFATKIPGEEKNFGQHVIEKDIRQLGEVVVAARKPPVQQKPEGLIVNVESSLLARGSSALDVLERSPGVMIDRYRNNFTLNGKSGAVVMINGKIMRIPMDQLLVFLNGLSANEIEKIELLTTPPPGYDAEGNAGIINIVLKQNKKKGTNGSVSLTAGYGNREKATAGVNIGRHTDKTDFYCSYSFSHNNTYSNFYGVGTEIVPALGGDMSFDFASETRSISKNHNVNLGVDVRPGPGWAVGANIIYGSSHASASSNNHGSYLLVPDSPLTFNGAINRTNSWENILSSFYVEKKLSTNEKINFNADYLNYRNNDLTSLASSTFNNRGVEIGVDSADQFSPVQRGFSNSTIRVAVVKLDYTKQLNKNLKLETGIKGTSTSSNGSSGIQSFLNGQWISRDATSANIGMNENIGAAFANITGYIGPSLNFSVGARYEYYHTHANNVAIGKDSFDRRLGQFFPSISLSRKINDKSELQISYSKRITRPAYNDLASYIIYNDPFSVFTGNPFLKPTITNNLKIGCNYLGYTLSLLLSRDDNPIVYGQLRSSASGKLVYILPENVTFQNNINLQVTVPIKIANWWEMNYVFIGGWREFRVDYTPLPAVKNYFGYSFNASEQFKLPKRFALEISGWYNSASYYGTSKINPRMMLNAGIKKELGDTKGTLQLSVSDIFQTGYGDSYFSFC